MAEQRKILVVDDSITTRDYISSILEEKGYLTDLAIHGLDALEKVSSSSYDCIVIDLLMPEMDGFEVMKKLKELKSTIPVIILTADIQSEAKEECLALGAKGFINKPLIDTSILLDSIENLLNP